MIINNERGTFSKKYTDEKIKQIVDSLEEKFGDINGASVPEMIAGKADAVEIEASETPRIVSYNEQGIITGGTELTAAYPLKVEGGAINHVKQEAVLSGQSYGLGNTIPVINVDEYGHIIKIETRSSATVPIATTKGQIIVSDEDGNYEVQSIDTSVQAGSYHLVTSGAVYDAIISNTTSLFRVKGSCTYDELMTKVAKEGDVWNVTDGDYAGANYVWVGGYGEEGEEDYVAPHWDKLSENLTSDAITVDDLDEHAEYIGTAAGYGHVMTSDDTPLANAIVGSAGSDNGKVARADHVHPIVTGAVEENQAFPASGDAVFKAIKALTDRLLNENGELSSEVLPDDLEVSNTWGNMTGDITEQEDLKEALDEKQDKAKVGTISLSKDNWTVDEGTGMCYQAVYALDEGGEPITITENTNLFLNWPIADVVASSYGIEAVGVVQGALLFAYDSSMGAVDTDITLEVMIM